MHSFHLFQVLSPVQKTSLLDTVCEENNTIMQFLPLEIRKQHTVLFGIHAKSTNTKISECLGVNLKTEENQTPSLHHGVWGGH